MKMFYIKGSKSLTKPGQNSQLSLKEQTCSLDQATANFLEFWEAENKPTMGIITKMKGGPK